MVLGGRERQRVHAVGHHDEAGFFARQELLDDDLAAGIAETAGEHGICGVDGLIRGLGNHYAFAGGEAARLDHDRAALRAHPGRIKGVAGEGGVGGGRDAVPAQEFFGEGLGALELCCGTAWPKAAQTGCLESVHHPQHQRRFRTDDRETDAFAARELDQAGDVLGGNRHIAHPRLGGGAGVAGRDQHFGDARRLCAMPSQRMLAATAADDQDFQAARVHGAAFNAGSGAGR